MIQMVDQQKVLTEPNTYQLEKIKRKKNREKERKVLHCAAKYDGHYYVQL